MRKPRAPRSGWAKITLGLSLLFAVGAFVYLSLSGAPLAGAALGALVVAAGIWEYRRKLQVQITAERYEAEAEENRQRNRR
jgi:ABC-type bacteriocin/lantibiotic exporter with double-glycine peptidase domain